ncbi:hypothetical protein C8Q74DRAFT_666507 [Fomes fomentarius]|nr:hypothetical protein C8Q74DRAFT_666507 [Fomes fomentarius]
MAALVSDGSSVPIHSVDSTLGAFLIGTIIGLVLYGLVIHKVWTYFKAGYSSDGIFLKAMVALLFSINTAHVFLCCHACYWYLVLNHGRQNVLQAAPWSIKFVPTTMIAVIFIVHLFYIRRIYLVGSPLMRKLLVVVGFNILCANIFAIIAAIEAWQLKTVEDWRGYTWLCSVAFGFVLATDIILTTMIIMFLRNNRTGLKSTETLLNKLILYAVNTGLLTSTLGLLALVFDALRLPNNMVFLAVSMSNIQTYVLSVLTVLNSRTSLAKIANGVHEL